MYPNPHQNYLQQQQLLANQAQYRNQQNQMGMAANMNPIMMQQMMQNMMANPAIMAQMMQMMQGGQGMVAPHQVQGQQHTGVIPNQQQQVLNTDRYGGGPIQQPQPQQQFKPQTEESRFNSQPEPQTQEVTETSKATPIQLYKVSTKHGSYPLTKKLSIAPKVTPFSEKSIHSLEKLTGYYSIREAAEEISKEFKVLDNIKGLITAESIIIDDGFEVTVDVPMFISLFQDDVKGLYKRIRSAYSEATNIDVAIMLNRIDEYFTKLTNDYLNINLSNGWSIDRFSLDFNDLLKLLRDNFEDEEDDLWEYLSKEITEMYTLMTSDDFKSDNGGFRFLSGVNVVCFKDHHFKAGLVEVKSGIYKLDREESNNTFLLSLLTHIFNTNDRKVFYFSTYDRELFKFTLSKSLEFFVERV